MKNSSVWFRIFSITILLLIIGIAGRIIFPPHAKLSKELSEGNFTVTELFEEFTGDRTNAYIRLANKVIILEGEIAATGDGYVVLGQDMCVVKCVFRKSIYDRKLTLKAGERATIKGICWGLNLTEILMTHCIVINKSTN